MLLPPKELFASWMTKLDWKAGTEGREREPKTTLSVDCLFLFAMYVKGCIFL